MVGVVHNVLFKYCKCECLAVALIRTKLWPTSVKSPRFAFTFALLDWAEALMVECQVALKDFCDSLKFRCPFVVGKGSIIKGNC